MDEAAIRREYNQGPKSPSALSNNGPKSPGHNRSFSFRSDKSGGSQKTKEDQRNSQFWKGGSKNNPNSALSEAQPGVNAILEENTLTPLRGLQHRDSYGNPITDPDLSNPTRPRLERPLDTIRSFERNIESGYKRRSSYRNGERRRGDNVSRYAENTLAPESYHGGQQDSQYGGSRRNSGYGESDLPYSVRIRQKPYANRSQQGFPDAQNRYSTMNSNGGGYYSGQRPDGFGPPSGPPRRFGPPRNSSDPMLYGQNQRPHPHAHQQSNDTMYTGVTHGSDSTGPWANSTDPSSENSSVEKGPSAMKAGYPDYPAMNNGYAPNGYGPAYGQGMEGPIPEDGAYTGGSAAPAVQPAQKPRPIALGNSGDPITELPSEKPEKRKSWLGRRFSRKN